MGTRKRQKMRDINVPCFQSDINRCKTRQFLPAYKLGTDPLLSAQTHILSKNEALNLHLGGADRDKKVRSNSVGKYQYMQMLLWTNVFMCKRPNRLMPSGQMSSGQMSSWANFFMGKCLYGQMLSGKMLLW
jgi:hypothetical protein